MKTPHHVWKKEVSRVGENAARNNLRWITRQNSARLSIESLRKPEEFKLLHSLAHLPGATPIENRKKYAEIFRTALRRIRDNRLRIASFAMPA